MNPSLVLITTCSTRSLELVSKLFDSALDGAPNVEVICVFQGVLHSQVAEIVAKYPNVKPLVTPGRVGLSAARNLAIDDLLNRTSPGNEVPTVVGFPDDDALIQASGIQYVMRHYSNHVGLLLGRFEDPIDGRPSRDAFEGGERRLDELEPLEIFKAANSNSMFVDVASLRRLGRFNEDLGVGGRYGSGEDVDFALRARHLTIPVTQTSAILSRHPVKAGHVRRYYVGNVALLATWVAETREWAYILMFVRRLANGLALAARHQIDWRSLLSAWLIGARILSRSGRGQQAKSSGLVGADAPSRFASALAGIYREPGSRATVTWFNHVSAVKTLRDAKLPLQDFTHIGVDGTLLQALLKRGLTRTSADLVFPKLFPTLNGARIAMIGGRAETIQARSAALNALLPGGVKVVLAIDGYDGVRDMAQLAKRVREAGADVVVIGAGAPLQDQVAVACAKNTSASLILTCGGYLDQLLHASYYPSWAHRLRMGWVIRLAREPRRLWRRYTLDVFESVSARRILQRAVTDARLAPQDFAFVNDGER